MQEIFDDINERVRRDIYNLFIVVTDMTNLPKAMELIALYRSTLSEREQEFMDFVFDVYMEEHGVYESNSD